VARNLFQAGVNRGLGDEDDAAIVKVIEGLANFTLEDYDRCDTVSTFAKDPFTEGAERPERW
jgi:hypothetical protein